MHPITEILLAWYSENKRDLPWRMKPSPYAIWLSEIMLQQTRVDQGTGYFLRFMDAFPEVNDLAAASQEQVLKMWQGLGYYSRARNLHAAAKQVVNDYGGSFPTTAEELQQLKGVGPYTAAAIASIAFGEPTAVVDGNVHRVMSRLYDIDEPVNRPAGHKLVQEAMNALLPKHRPGDFNQAVMEFGALHCTPKRFDCAQCPLQQHCMAHANGTTNERPVKASKTQVKAVWYDYFIFEENEAVWMRQRGSKGIWAGLNDFPALEWESEATEDAIHSVLIEAGVENARLSLLGEPVVHLLSHRRITARFFSLEAAAIPERWMGAQPVPLSEIRMLAVPRLIERFLNEWLPDHS